jgi:membrane-bound inhibitor of C-type lysozyme
MSALIRRLALPPLSAAVLLLTAVAPVAAESLQVELRETVRYSCEGGAELVVTYGQLSDSSLAFARLQPPGETLITLPQLVSGSGARYSTEQLWQWWSQGEEGFLQRRNEQGGWNTVLAGCLSDLT